MVLEKLFKLTLIITIATLLLEGGIFLAKEGTQKPHYHVFSPGKETLMEWGIFFLAFIPMVIALGAFIVFLHQRDFLYVAITAILLAILALSITVN